ncbi:MAG TPA: flagellin, partial [Verrucomicrobiales bacterium]|nr:flagellin [Verrucomicrobiales bacterium]
AASSQIKDIDVAYESAHYARLSLKVQTASAILAQSNVLSQSALRLLGIT